MQQHSIFLHNVTLIDAAYIDSRGRPRGLSVNPVFTVSAASLNGEEQVVADFSNVKKEIKQLIDDKEQGFDHKLWIDSNHWAGSLVHNGETCVLHTDYLSLEVPRNAVRMVPGMHSWEELDDAPEFSSDKPPLATVATAIADYINASFQSEGKPYRVQCTLPNPTPVELHTLLGMHGINMLDADVVQFCYTHGLPKSTSWGCQNILHGHSSFLVLGGENGGFDQTELANTIAHSLNDSYLYDVNNEVETDAGFGLSYTTERGRFSLLLSSSPAYAVDTIAMRAAPTIENIVTYIATIYAANLDAAGVTFLGISEGLWKGAHVTCNNWQDTYGG